MDPKFWNAGKPIDQLIEECSEVIHILCKCSQFGWHNFHPADPKKTPNYDLVVAELDDLKLRIGEFEKWMEIHNPHNNRPAQDGGSDCIYDFELDATPDTLCGRLGRKHRMKRIHHSLTKCIYPGCEGYC